MIGLPARGLEVALPARGLEVAVGFVVGTQRGAGEGDASCELVTPGEVCATGPEAAAGLGDATVAAVTPIAIVAAATPCPVRVTIWRPISRTGDSNGVWARNETGPVLHTRRGSEMARN